MGDSNRFIEELEERPLSDSDIRAIAGKDCMIIQYSYLKHVPSIDQLFKYENACVILYKSTPTFGHWVCVTVDPKERILYYFDSYGKDIDHWLQKQDGNTRRRLGQEADYLTMLVDRALIKGILNGVDVNNKALQSSDSRVADCGRYAALRALFQHLPNQDFIRMITDNKGYGTVADRNVTLLTALLAS